MFIFGLRIVYRAIALVISAALVYFVVSVVQVETASKGALPSWKASSHAAAIIVTGTPGARTISTDYRARLRVAWKLYSGKHAPLLFIAVSSGANRAGALNSKRAAELASVVKTSHDLTAVLASTSSKEFSRIEKRIGRGRHVIVVTDAIDALYMESLAAGDGFHPQVVAPTPSKKLLFSQFAPLLREASGVAVGRVFGFGNATWASK